MSRHRSQFDTAPFAIDDETRTTEQLPAFPADDDEARGTERLPIFAWEVPVAPKIHPRLVSRRPTGH